MAKVKESFHLSKGERKQVEERRRQGGDHRIVRRLCALIWLDDGLTQEEVAHLLGTTDRVVRKWIKLYRQGGVEKLCDLGYRGRQCELTAEQIEQLLEQIQAGRFRAAKQVRRWLEETFGKQYSLSGVKDLLRRLGASFHKTSALMFKADPQKQEEFLKKYRQQKPQPGERVRRYFVDATHPVWGLQVLNYRWLLQGQRFYVGVGGGRKRLSILGGWCPEEHEYLDLRLPDSNVNAQSFIDFMSLLRTRHPKTKKFILYLDNARYFHAVMARQWIDALQKREGVRFVLEHLPAYSPNLNLIERFWKFLKQKALSRWHESFEAMQAAVARVLDRLEHYRTELETLMTENFQLWPQEAWNL